ncbi:MAG TPA: hypothetical protein VM049_02530 [Gaiellaceae bacterium]|nr:hypothetical protein [Gaiellaceae bacterium]
MARKMKHKLAAGAGAALAVAGGGAAIAATQLSPKAESEAVVNDAAKQLGVTPAKLNDALKQALSNRIDAAVAAGTLTKAQGEEMKARIASGDFPLFGGRAFGHERGEHHGGFGAHLSAAATYLGVTEASLRTSLEGGKTLAALAKEKGKSASGLVDALVADETKELDAAVAAGRLTKTQRDALVTNARQRFQDLVDGKMPAPGSFRGHDGFGFRGGPRGADGDAGYRFGGGRTPVPPATPPAA